MTISFNRLGNLGHLGNQMFQLAATMGVAAHHNTDYIIPPYNRFGKKYPIRSKIDHAFDLSCERRVSRDFERHKEKRFWFDASLFETNEPIDLDLSGYFQSEKYFRHIAKDVRATFNFKDELKQVGDRILNDMSQSKLLGIHVRRSDYLNETSIHPTMPVQYYDLAIKMMPSDVDVIVVSDDASWTKEQSVFNKDNVKISDSNSPYVDMYLLTRCSHHIISNSSFSWWGAWLADSKITIAPNKWVRSRSSFFKKMDDLYPKHWIRI